MKRFLGILVLSLLCFNIAFATDKIKPKKTPLNKLSKQLGNGKLVKIQSYQAANYKAIKEGWYNCLLYTSPSPRDVEESRMPSSA